MFPPLWTFFVTKRRTCQNVSLVVAACERDICLPSRLNIQRQSVSQWYPCGCTLCWGSDPHRQKSYQNAQQQSDWTPPAPLDQQNGNSVTVNLKLCCRPGSHISWWNYSKGNTKWFRIHFIWPGVLFLSAHQTWGGWSMTWLSLLHSVRPAVCMSDQVGEAERRRWEVVNA